MPRVRKMTKTKLRLSKMSKKKTKEMRRVTSLLTKRTVLIE